MDIIKEKINEIVEKIKTDKDIAKKFKADPITTVDGIKAKIALDKIDLDNIDLGKAANLLGGIFGKK